MLSSVSGVTHQASRCQMNQHHCQHQAFCVMCAMCMHQQFMENMSLLLCPPPPKMMCGEVRFCSITHHVGFLLSPFCSPHHPPEILPPIPSLAQPHFLSIFSIFSPLFIILYSLFQTSLSTSFLPRFHCHTSSVHRSKPPVVRIHNPSFSPLRQSPYTSPFSTPTS
jgi:hypothetical protein